LAKNHKQKHPNEQKIIYAVSPQRLVFHKVIHAETVAKSTLKTTKLWGYPLL